MKIAKILAQNTTGLENSNHVFNLSYFAFKKKLHNFNLRTSQ